MSSVTVLLRENVGYVFADTAMFDSDARMTGEASKLYPHPECKAVLAMRGTLVTHFTADAYKSAPQLGAPSTLEDMYEALPGFTRDLHAHVVAVAGDDPGVGIEITVVGWSPVTGRPECRGIASYPVGAYQGVSQMDCYEPFKVTSCPDIWFAPGCDAALSAEALAPFSGRAPAYWDPWAFGLTVIQAQRIGAKRLDGSPHSAIGGHLQLGRVSALATTVETVGCWQDRLGEPIDVSRPLREPQQLTLADVLRRFTENQG